MTDADLEKHTDIMVSTISDILKRVPELTPGEDQGKELSTELEDLLLIVESQRRSIRLTKEATKDRELRKEKELQEALAALAQFRSEKEQSPTESRPIPIQSSFARKIGDDVRSFFTRPSSSNSPTNSLSGSREQVETGTPEPEGWSQKQDHEKVAHLKEANEAMYTILTKFMDDNTHLIEDIESLIRDKKKLEAKVETWTLKYNTLELKFKELLKEKETS